MGFVHRVLRGINEFRLIVNRNSINAHYHNIPAKKNKVNIYEYHPELLGHELYNRAPYNLGDSLGKVIIQYLLGKKNIDIDKNISKTKHFNCVGSNVLHSYQDATIWGSGIEYKPTNYNVLFTKLSRRKLDIRAVRGPLTKEQLEKMGYIVPDIYGDPAILLPLIYNPNVEKKYKYSVIPQFVVEKDFRERFHAENIISMNTNNYKQVIDNIKASEIVITSSLHGIILAESYNVPAVFFRGLSKSVDFKYYDYYLSTGRPDIKIADTFEEAKKMSPLSIPDLTKLQQGLLDSFPYDLWEI